MREYDFKERMLYFFGKPESKSGTTTINIKGVNKIAKSTQSINKKIEWQEEVNEKKDYHTGDVAYKIKKNDHRAWLFNYFKILPNGGSYIGKGYPDPNSQNTICGKNYR